MSACAAERGCRTGAHEIEIIVIDPAHFHQIFIFHILFANRPTLSPVRYGVRGFVRDNLPIIPDTFTLVPRQVEGFPGR